MALAPDEIDSVRPPSTVKDLGVPVGLAEDLLMRRVLTERTTTIGQASALLCVSHGVGLELTEALREKAQIEYLGATGRDYRIQLTELGHRTTSQRMSNGRHVGAMPVPLSLYRRVVNAQRSQVKLDRETMRAAFSDLVLQDSLLDQIGPAFVSGGAIFLYGPAGTGKTSLAERMNRIFDDPVLIPHFVEIDGQVISVFDPSVHHPLEEQSPQVDRRWVLCERPLIIVGGELDLGMLDLRYDRISGISSAPIQMAANNGILVVDDFGRQAIRPEEILNRWIVPLSRGIDYLKANNGTKFTVPFELKLVISTNLDPNSLGDDAFLRRLRNKVFIGPVSEDDFAKILNAAVDSHGIKLTADATEHLCEVARQQIGELRPYLATDFCQLTTAICDYERCERVLDAEMIDRVADLYFVQREAQEMRSPQLDIWSMPQAATLAGTESSRHWSEYEIAGIYHDDPLAGLDALAATQSVEGQAPVEGVPAALQSLSRPPSDLQAD